MKLKLKQLEGLMLALIFGAVLAFMPSFSHAAEAANASPQPLNRAGIVEMLQYQGIKVKRISASSTATLLHNGPGFLDAICSFGGTLGKYSIAYDTLAITGVADDLYTNAISPKVYVANDSTSAQGGMLGCWVPPAPIKFVSALYGKASDAAHQTFFYGHCSDGSNPCLF